MVPYSLVIIKQ